MNYFFLAFLIIFTLIPNNASAQEADEFEVGNLEDLESFVLYLDLAESYYLEDEFEVAISFYDQALEIDPSSIDALNGKANALYELGEYEEAITYYNHVLEIDPDDVDALNGISASLDAISEFEVDNLAQDLESLVEYLEQAENNVQEDEFEVAISFYDQALEIDPSSIDALNGKANALYELGEYEEAITYYNHVLEIDPDDVDALNGKANALNAIGMHEEAIINFDKVLDMVPSDIIALNGKALALESLGDVDEAILLLEQIIESSETEIINEPLTVDENNANLENAEIQEFDQTLLVIIGLFVIILGIIIVLDLIARKKRITANNAQKLN